MEGFFHQLFYVFFHFCNGFIRRELLNSLKSFDTKKRLSQIYSILKKSDLPINYFLLSFICSLEICINIFGGFKFRDESNLNLKKFKEIGNNVNIFGEDFDKEFKDQLSHFLTNLYLEKGILEEDNKNLCLKLMEAIKSKFKVQMKNKDLEKMLFNKLYLSFFKYNNKIIRVINVSFNRPHKIILNNLDDILKEFSCNLYVVDKFMIVYIIRRIIVDENFSDIKNVLLLFNDVIAIDQILLKNSLKVFQPHINFDIEATFLHAKNIIQNYEKYDIIISDSNIISNAKIVEYYNTINIQSILENHALMCGLKKLNNY